MRRFPNEIAVKAMFEKVCERVRAFTASKQEYQPMTDYEIDKMMEEVLGPKK